MRRTVDLFVALTLAPIALLIVAIVSLAILIVDHVPPIFLQQRVGLLEKPFTIYKLRTMRPGTDNIGTHETNTSSLLKTGHIIRRLKLDELPQLVNVILGEMTLVGPRPGLSSQTQLNNERRSLNVFSVKPGITGLGQVHGVDMSEPARLAQLDAWYIKERNILLDLRIVFRTITGKGFRDSVGDLDKS